MDQVEAFFEKGHFSEMEDKFLKRYYAFDFKDQSWDIRFTLEKPRAYIIIIMAVVGLFQLASHKTIFGTISLACAFLAVFAYQAGVRKYNQVNQGIDKLTIAQDGITEELEGNKGTRQYPTHQITSIFTTCVPDGNRFLISIHIMDSYGGNHPIITFRTKDPSEEETLAKNLATAIKSYIGFQGV